MEDLKIVLITQARYGSSRLPGKILKKINNESLLKIHLNRLKKCNNVTDIHVATTNEIQDEVIYNKVIDWGFKSSRGSEYDVLDRFYNAVKNKNVDWIVRVTSDCPLIDPILVDKIINYVVLSKKDYGSNILIENFPDGQDVEVFKYSALELAWKNSVLSSDREHVTTYIRNNSDFNGGSLFTSVNFPSNKNYSHIRMTVDEDLDLELITILINKLGTEKTWEEYTDFIIKNQLYKINSSIIRNEGLIKSLKND